MFKKSKLNVAISLVIQSLSMLVLFFIFMAKKKSIAGAFLAVATLEGSAAAYLFYQIKEEKEDVFDPEVALAEDDLDIDEDDITAALSRADAENTVAMKDIEIPREDVVSDAEFDD